MGRVGVGASGQDKVFIKDGGYYEGKCVNGEIMGNGFQYWASTGRTVTTKKTPNPISLKSGRWRNDVFNEWGAIVNCSGDICDGLWINGSPAASGNSGGSHGGVDVSVRRTTAEQITAAHEGPHAQSRWIFPKGTAAHGTGSTDRSCGLWRADAGAGLKSVNSCHLEIWAGTGNHQAPSSSATNLFELIEETERKTVNFCVCSLRKSQFHCVFPLINISLQKYFIFIFFSLWKGGKKPSGRISAEKAEKMTVSQEKMEDSRPNYIQKKNSAYWPVKSLICFIKTFVTSFRSRMTSKECKLQKDQHLKEF
ncbi:LOW QUALITY PROTEIN: MORN repeat-containing protein 1 [Guaruba guarouba]